MFYKQKTAEEAKLVPFIYYFLKPCTVRKMEVDGTINLIGYGIGDRIEILRYNIVLPVAIYDREENILLADGSIIIEYPDDIELRPEITGNN